MASAALPVEELLKPVSEEKPAGEDITITPDWPAINEARRKDPVLGRANCDWPLIEQLIVAALGKSKDLRLALWLTEAAIKLHGFAGLRDGAALVQGLVENFWDTGLYPEAEGGDLQYRASPLEWFSSADGLPFSLRQVPLTNRSDGGTDYSYSAYRVSRDIGWEKDTRNALGDVDDEKDRKRKSRIASGGISAEMFEDAVRFTRRAGMEAIRADWEAANTAFLALDKVLDAKFGAEAPATSDTKEALEDCRRVLDDLLKRKRQEEPDVTAPGAGGDGGEPAKSAGPMMLGGAFLGVEEGDGGSWAEAERMVQQGDVAGGLMEMTKLAAAQFGRANFQRRLRLAEICLQTSRTKMGIAILEELAKKVDEHKLEAWESSALLGRVWGKLYQCYKSAEPGSEESGRAMVLFDRLCRLDPWQALRWE